MLNKLDLNLVNSEHLLDNNRYIFKLFRVFLSSLGVTTLLCGLLPGFISFGRIFYTSDTYIFLGLYLTIVGVLIINYIGFIIISLSYKVFTKRRTPLLIVLIYLLLFLLFSLNAYLFTEFNLTENGYEVPFNLLMYIIDFLILFPLWIFIEYYLNKFVRNKLTIKENIH